MLTCAKLRSTQLHILWLAYDIRIYTYLLYGSKEKDMGWKGQGIIYSEAYIIPFPFSTHILLATI